MIVNVSTEAEQRLQELAVSRGLTVTDLASTLLEEKLCSEAEGEIRLSYRDRDLFLAALDADEEPSPALHQAVQRYRETITQIDSDQP